MNVFRKLPKELCIAVSGGSDSVFAFHWLKEKGHTLKIAHYAHVSKGAQEELGWVSNFASDNNVKLIVGYQQREKPTGESTEEFWRNDRYSFFKTLDETVVIGHMLDDAVEGYLFNALNGKISILNYSHANCVRPFILQRKHQMVDYLIKNNHDWLEDETNKNVKFAVRNKIRHDLIPHALEVNKGLYSMVKNMIVEKHK